MRLISDDKNEYEQQHDHDPLLRDGKFEDAL